MIRALFWIGLIAGCKQASVPTGFGVNVTVDGSQLSAADRARITKGALSVVGDEPFAKIFDLPIQSGRVRFRYIPLIRSGNLTFLLEARDAGGAAVAAGASGVVALTDGRAVEAVITLTAGAAFDLSVPPSDEGISDGGTQLGNGTACGGSEECESGFCVDGVCCESECTLACHTCGLPGALGICNLAPSGTDPHDSCGDDGTACGLDGTCNGTGGCRFRTIDVVCRAQTCDVATGTLTSAATCDGNGACPASAVTNCSPYICKSDGTDCFSDCVPDGGSGECEAPKICTSGSCGPKPSGRACAGDTECLSGKCRDGVCCATECNTACFACNLAGKEGTCSPTKAGSTAPAGACTNPTNLPCGPTGKCDGTGKCAFPSANICANGTCSSGPTANKAKRCDGAGNCVVASPATDACDHYACYTSASGNFNETYCYTSCGSCNGLCIIGGPCPILYQSHCASGRTCTDHCASATNPRISCD